MMRKAAIAFVLILVLFFIGCQKQSEFVHLHEQSEVPAETTGESIEETGAVSPEKPGKESVEEPEVEGDLSCTHNSNCTGGELCIEGKCQVLANFYETDDICKKCRLSKIEILTSDGGNYVLSPGQGSYTAAGALDWTIVKGEDYCQGNEVKVPIKILKRNYGEIFSDKLIILKAGETSKVITHPFMKRVAFTLKIVSVEEDCS
jgi:hypothetical protein